MKRNRLEMYVDILKVLAHKGPQKFTTIMFLANVNSSVLKMYLDFMVEQELVERKKISRKRVVYDIAERGLNVLKYFRELKTMLPVAVIRESAYVKNQRERHESQIPP